MSRSEPQPSSSILSTDTGEGPSSSTLNTPGTRNKQPRTHFPSLEQDLSYASGGSNGSLRKVSPSSIGLGPPPTNPRRASIQGRPGPSSSSSFSRQQHDIRRRVRSIHTPGYEDESILAGISPSSSMRKRTLTHQGLSNAPLPRAHFGEPNVESPSDDIGPGVFSDEYDLSHDDPQILADVQRALKAKARREARKRANPAIRDVASISTMGSTIPSNSSYSPLSSPSRPTTFLSSNSPAPAFHPPSTESEVDFSPSVGVDRLHPVPTSSNNGATLDWGNYASEDEKSEKRWSLSKPKKKGKEKQEGASKEVVEKQESVYLERLHRIRQAAKPATTKKAEITAQQLSRRYGLLFSTLGTTQEPVLTKVVRWYSNLDPSLQTSLIRAEPHAWAKHLRDRKEHVNSLDYSWHVSALTVEEYVKANVRREAMETIPEDGDVLNSPTAHGFSPYLPGSPVPKRPSSEESASAQIAASLSRRRSLEGHVSFGPVTESARGSMTEDPRRRSVDGMTKWRNSLPANDSPRSSIYSSIFSGTGGGVSPSSSRRQLRELTKRLRRIGHESDDGSSSHLSVSDHDHSHSESGSAPQRKARRRSRPPELDTSGKTRARSNDNGGELTLLEEDEKSPFMPEDPITAKLMTSESSPEAHRNLPERPSSPSHGLVTPRIPFRTHLRTSLPNSERTSLLEEEQQQQQYDEEAERREYERREQLLESATAQNHRNRQLLNRIQSSVKEYESLQSSLYKLLGLSRTPLPADLIEVLSHDPANVTGPTKGVRGWRAVEKIHDTLIHQAETIQAFLQFANTMEIGSVHPNAADQHLAGLTQALDTLESRRLELEERSEAVAEKLAQVKALHATVRTEYRQAVQHTSAVYPELSRIVELEESYKDNYQQLWEFGMDALTLVLDTITPFWRVYGKIIGEDVTDFLIIPWYRNEFTGEDKRYPIKFPKRSFRHWVGLFVFFAFNVGFLSLQIGGAVASSLQYRLPFSLDIYIWWFVIPTFWIIVLIQWVAALIELGVVALQVLCVLWWVAWWAKIVD